MDRRTGQVISFYSYKGGVGRSMAMANIGRLLAAAARQKNRAVLLIDWDLEAPGLHSFFSRSIEPEHPGLIEYFLSFEESLTHGLDAPQLEGFIARGERPPMDQPRRAYSGVAGLDLLKAGAMDERYAQRVSDFSWTGLHARFPEAIAAFRGRITAEYEYVLIDSRTGVSDITGICTALLPDKLVTVFAPNLQNLSGLGYVIPQILSYRRNSADERPLVVFPVPSRFDAFDLPKQMDYLTRFRNHFESTFKREYRLDACDLREHFKETMLPYVPSYSYGEPVVVGPDEPDYPGALKAAYQRLASRLLRETPW